MAYNETKGFIGEHCNFKRETHDAESSICLPPKHDIDHTLHKKPHLVRNFKNWRGYLSVLA